MSKIFGISSLPVTTIESSLRGLDSVPKPITRLIRTNSNIEDKFIPKTRKTNLSPFIKMRNGFGKLMSHFSKKS